MHLVAHRGIQTLTVRERKKKSETELTASILKKDPKHTRHEKNTF